MCSRLNHYCPHGGTYPPRPECATGGGRPFEARDDFSLTGELADVMITPVDTPTYTDPTLDQEEQIRQALAQRPDLIQAKLTLENQHITLVFDQNQTCLPWTWKPRCASMG